MYAEIKGTPKIGQHWGTAPLQWGVPDTIEMCLSTRVLLPDHICLKNVTPRVLPFKVTRTDTDRAAYDFLLTYRTIHESK